MTSGTAVALAALAAWCVGSGCAADVRDARAAGKRDSTGAADGATPSEVQFAAITVGGSFACALTPDRTAYCWGQNEQGELGDGGRHPGSSARPVRVAGDHAFRAVSAGGEHACALTPEGEAFCWGYGPEGALGVRQDTAWVPTPVATDLRFASISAGGQRTCAVTTDGAAYCWGRFSRPSDDPAGSGGPELVPVRAPVRFRSVAAGLSHACGITEDQALYCWGLNGFGAVGVQQGVSPQRWVPPQQVPLAEAVTSVSVSGAGTCAVTASGAAYCWGANASGQLGDGTWTDRYAPNPVPARVFGDQRWKQVTTGGLACGLTVEGEVYCWGATGLFRAVSGDLAPERCDTLYTRGGVSCSTRPVPLPGGLRFRSLATGAPACAISVDGVAYCWGAYNTYGNLGNGTFSPSPTPTPLADPASDSTG